VRRRQPSKLPAEIMPGNLRRIIDKRLPTSDQEGPIKNRNRQIV
jgi:hypothetical protein